MREKLIKKINQLYINYFNESKLIYLKNISLLINKNDFRRLLFYDNCMILVDNNKMKILKFNANQELDRVLFDFNKNIIKGNISIRWSIGDSNDKYLLILYRDKNCSNKFILYDLRKEETVDSFRIDIEDDIYNYLFAVKEKKIYLNINNKIYIRNIEEKKTIIKYSLSFCKENKLISSFLYILDNSVNLLIYNSFMRPAKTDIYQIDLNKYVKINSINPYISFLDINNKGNIYSYSSFDNKLKIYDNKYNLKRIYSKNIKEINIGYIVSNIIIDKEEICLLLFKNKYDRALIKYE